MAKSATERSREFRARQKKAAKAPGDNAGDFLETPFFEFFHDDGNKDALELPLELANIVPPRFENDGPAVFPGDLDDLDLPTANNSIERAELIIDCLLDAATGLAGIVNRYKRKEITDRIHEIETSDLSDAKVRKQALADIVRLKKMLDQLDKQVRHTLPQWKVTGD